MNARNIFRIFRQEFRSSIYFKKILYSYLLVSCVIFIIFSVVFFMSANKDYNDTLEDLQSQMLVQAYSINQTVLKDICAYCYSLMGNSSMSKLLYEESYDSVLALEATEIIENIRQTSSLVTSAYLINFRTGRIIDNNGRMSIENHIDSSIFEILDTLEAGITPTFFYPRVIDIVTSGRVSYDAAVLTTIFYYSSSGALVINLDYNKYQEMLSLNENDNISICMLDSSGRVMASSENSSFGADHSEDELYLKIQQEDSKQGAFPYSSDGNYYSVQYIKNSGFGITYICTLSKLHIYPQNSLFFSLLRYTLVYLVIGFALSLLLSWFIYNPLRQLKAYIAGNTEISSAESDKEQSNDFSYLSHAYKEIMTINSNLRQISQSYQKERHMKLFRRLLTDASAVSSAYSSELEALNASFHSRNFLILLLGVDPSSLRTEIQIETNLLKYVLQNVTEELLTETAAVQHVEMEESCVVLLLNFDDMDFDWLKNAIVRAQNFVEQYYHVTFSAGIGDTVQEFAELSSSYFSAYEAFSQRFLTGSGSVHTASDLSLTPVHEQHYPSDTAGAILAAVRTLSAAEAEKQIHLFFAAVNTYNIDQILISLLLLSSSLQKLENSAYIELTWDWSYRALENSTLAEIERQMISRCLYDIEKLTQIRDTSSGKKELIEKINTLVEENLYNPDLSVVYLADQVHLSVNYLRSIFKENTGDSLSNYITGKKLELICELLLNTDISLNDISDKLGFSTKNYFFTFFKKHKGMTPGEFRRSYKKNTESAKAP